MKAALALVDRRPLEVLRTHTYFKSLIMNNPPAVTTSTIWDEELRSYDSHLNTLSSFIAVLSTLYTDVDISVPDNAVAELEKVKAGCCKDFDTFVTISNSMTATYRTLVQRHGDCERSIKDLTASGNSNTVTINVQVFQIQKAQLEREMLYLEKAQCRRWKRIPVVQKTCK